MTYAMLMGNGLHMMTIQVKPACIHKGFSMIVNEVTSRPPMSMVSANTDCEVNVFGSVTRYTGTWNDDGRTSSIEKQL